jgi:hypothetical protein
MPDGACALKLQLDGDISVTLQIHFQTVNVKMSLSMTAYKDMERHLE